MELMQGMEEEAPPSRLTQLSLRFAVDLVIVITFIVATICTHSLWTMAAGVLIHGTLSAQTNLLSNLVTGVVAVSGVIQILAYDAEAFACGPPAC